MRCINTFTFHHCFAANNIFVCWLEFDRKQLSHINLGYFFLFFSLLASISRYKRLVEIIANICENTGLILISFILVSYGEGEAVHL